MLAITLGMPQWLSRATDTEHDKDAAHDAEQDRPGEQDRDHAEQVSHGTEHVAVLIVCALHSEHFAKHFLKFVACSSHLRYLAAAVVLAFVNRLLDSEQLLCQFLLPFSCHNFLGG